jgi:hypothetical protein
MGMVLLRCDYWPVVRIAGNGRNRLGAAGLQFPGVLLSRLALDYNAGRIAAEVAMRVDRVEVSWDATKSKWLVRMESGEEVIRRHSDVPKDADEQSLRAAAQKIAQDEGYEADLASISIRR